MLYLLCIETESCGSISTTEEIQSSVVATCPHCSSPAIVFPDRLSAIKAANKTESEKEVRVALVAEIIKKIP